MNLTRFPAYFEQKRKGSTYEINTNVFSDCVKRDEKKIPISAPSAVHPLQDHKTEDKYQKHLTGMGH